MTPGVSKKHGVDIEAKTVTKETLTTELNEGSIEALKMISTLGSTNGLEQFLNGDTLTANLENMRTKKNMRLFEQLNKTREELKQLSDAVDQMERHVLDLKTASKTSN